MPRRPRTATGGYVYHVLNRAVGRATVFHKRGDYAAFERILRQTKNNFPTRLLAYCLMPNHFHLILWPTHDGELSDFLHWLTLTHTMRWHAHYHSSGTGPLYQGRFKSFPIQEDDHFFTVCRYVERNPLRRVGAARPSMAVVEPGTASRRAELLVSQMIDALEGLRARDTGSISMVGTILSLTFETQKEPRKPTELSVFQREIVRRLAQSDRAWDWGNVFWTFRQFGLPERKETLAEFWKLAENI